MFVIACAPADRPVAEQFARFLSDHARLCEIEDGSGPIRHLQPGDVLIALVSQNAILSADRMRFDRRALEAWADERLVLVKLDHHFAPVGLRDLPFVDASWETQRDFAWRKALQDADARARPAAPSPPPPPQPPGGGEGGETTISRDETDEARKRVPEPKLKPSGGLLGRLLGKKATPAPATPAARPAPAPAPQPAEASVPQAEPEPAAPASDGIFISYAHADSDQVTPLVAIVERTGARIWIDKAGIEAGEGWAGEIVRAIRSADGVAFMCSPQSVASDHVRRELYLADRYRKRMVPILLEPVELPEEFEYFFAGVQWLEWFRTPETEREAVLARALKG